MERLRKRRDFLAAARAERAGATSLTLQGRNRAAGSKPGTRQDDAPDAIRLGFTVTKKTGNAVMRNRIRRRLRAAAQQVLPGAAQGGFDYVIVARPEALHAPYDTLVGDLSRALRRLHSPKAKGGRGRNAPSARAEVTQPPALPIALHPDPVDPRPVEGLAGPTPVQDPPATTPAPADGAASK